MPRFQALDAGMPAKLSGYRSIRCDDQSARKPVAERIGRALHHRGSGLADRKDADGSLSLGCRKRRAHAAPPVHGGEGGPKEVQQEASTRIDAFEGDVPLHRHVTDSPGIRMVKGRVPFDGQLARAVRPPGRSRRRWARTPSERSCSIRARNSRVTSPVTYSPEKQEVSKAVIRASSCRQAATSSSRSWYTSQSAPIEAATSSSLRPLATSSEATAMSMP